MIRWTKTGKTVKASGETIITYEPANVDGLYLKIESRKRNIPHASGSGHWQHTSYFLINEYDGTEKEYYSLRDAKEAAEGRA